MARKTNPLPWLQVFQKSKTEIENPQTPHVRSDHPVLLEDEPPQEEPVSPEQNLSEQPRTHRAARVANQVSSAARATVQRAKPLMKAWKWQLIWLSIFAVFGGTGLLALWWISKVPPAVDCQKISNWSTDSDRLFCAQQGAQSGKPEQLIAAINLVKNWTSEHELYTQAQLLLQDWSNALLILARDRLSQRDLKGAIALASQVPNTSLRYKEAQAAIDRWQEEYRKGQKLYDKIQEALKKQNWDKSSELLAQLSLINDPGWQERIGEVREQENSEKAAWKDLKDARNFAKSNPQERWGQAIALTDPINRKTYVWTLQAEKEVVRWRNAVFGLAIARLDKQDVPGASTLINSIPDSVQLTSANRDFVRLVRGKEAEAEWDYRAPSLEKLPPLLLATHLVKQIDAQSPFYGRAKALIPKLEQKAQDLMQLNLAGALANMQQVPTLKWASDQAKAVQLKRPGRIYAQTLLAQWQKEVQSMEDRPQLRQARQVAKSGKLGQLRSAVAMATLVKPGRALRTEAQTDIANWTYQIQVLEDRPIIASAKAIAGSGRLGEAIQVASKIRAGRALYGEAQNLIGGWIYEIQIIEDRPIIAQASGLAASGYLTRAIEVASSIAPGRALYGEAQGLIGQWAAQRAEIWRQQERESVQWAPQPYQDQPSQADYYRDEPRRSDVSPEPPPP